MTTKHTPGPWNQCAAILTERGMVYGINAWADIDGYNRPQDCRIAETFSIEANARLIAAAPDLLAALDSIATYAATQKLLHPNSYTLRAILDSIEKEARAALKRAKG